MPGGSKMIESKYQKQTTKLANQDTLSGKATLQKWSGDKDFPRQKNSLIMTRLGIQQMLKGVLEVERILNSRRKT